MKVFAKALKSFNQKAIAPTIRLRGQVIRTVFAQEIEDLQSKKGLIRKPLIHPTPTRQTLHELNLRHGVDPDVDERLKHSGLQPIAPMTLGGLLESSAAFPVSAARQEMFEGHRKPFERSDECPACPTQLIKISSAYKCADVGENTVEYAHRKVQLYLGQLGKHVDIHDHITAQGRFQPDSSLTGDFLINIQIDGIVIDNLARRFLRGQIAGGVGKRIQAFTALVAPALEEGGFRFSKIEQLAKEIPQGVEEGKKPFTLADLGRLVTRPSNAAGYSREWMEEDSEVRQVIYDDLKAIGASVGWIWNVEFLYKIAQNSAIGYFVMVTSPGNLCNMSHEIATSGSERFVKDLVHDKQIAFATVMAQTLESDTYSAKKIHALAKQVCEKALAENPKAEASPVSGLTVAVMLKDVIGGKYADMELIANKVMFQVYPSVLAHKHNEPIPFQISLPYAGLFTLFKEEMLNELSRYPGLNAAMLKDIGDQDPARHNRHVRHLMGNALVKVVQIEKRVIAIDAELYEYITPATSL
jgi:hypothetical protein